MRKLTITILCVVALSWSCVTPGLWKMYKKRQKEIAIEKSYWEGYNNVMSRHHGYSRPSMSRYQYENYYKYNMRKVQRRWGHTSRLGRKMLLKRIGHSRITYEMWKRGARPPYWNRYDEYRSREAYYRRYHGYNKQRRLPNNFYNIR